MLEFSNLKWRTPPKYFLLLDTSKTYAMTARYCTRSIIGADDQVPRLINLGIINTH